MESNKYLKESSPESVIIGTSENFTIVNISDLYMDIEVSLHALSKWSLGDIDTSSILKNVFTGLNYVNNLVPLMPIPSWFPAISTYPISAHLFRSSVLSVCSEATNGRVTGGLIIAPNTMKEYSNIIARLKLY